MERPTRESFRRKVSHVFIGIDFGTSYTKVSFSYAPTNNRQINTIKWGDSYFKPSVLYIKDESLYYDEPTTEHDIVKYFKYSVIEKNLINTQVPTNNNLEEMCCVYFLAQVINHSLEQIKNILKLDSFDGVNVTINMGVPLENFYEEHNADNKGLYRDILESAVLLVGGSKVHAVLPDNEVSIKNLDAVYSEVLVKKPYLNWNINVYPELAAELLLYFNSPTIPDSVYGVIDVGGGTLDMALFQKDSVMRRKSLTCIKQVVLPYGLEVITSLSEEQKSLAASVIRETFNEMVLSASHYDTVKLKYQNKVDVFFLGGGSTNPWYKECIEVAGTWLQNALLPKLELDNSIDDYLADDDSLLEKQQRLIISQMLSRDKSEIQEVQGYPNYYEEMNNKTEISGYSNYYSNPMADELYENGMKYWD